MKYFNLFVIFIILIYRNEFETIEVLEEKQRLIQIILSQLDKLGEITSSSM